MTQGGDQVADQDADDDEDQGQTMGDVQESITVKRAKRNPRNPNWLTTNMIIVYALPVTEEAFLLHIVKLISVQNLRYARMP